jgi:hypothetical protein
MRHWRFGAAVSTAGRADPRAADGMLGGGASMARCSVCGNDYDKAFTVTLGGQTRTFDAFECAIQAFAPTCAHCKVKIVGHGVEKSGTFYCCAHCAEQEGVKGLEDRV